MASGERHDGTAGTGCRVVRSSGALAWVLTVANDARDIAWMDLNGNDLTGGAGSAVRILDCAATTCLVRARRLLVHNVNGNSAANDVNLVRMSGSTGSTLNNSVLYNLDNTSILSSTAHTSGVNSQTTASLFLDLANCVIDNIHTANTGSSFAEGVRANDTSTLKIRNTIVTDVSHDGGGTETCFQNSSWSSATVDHNASEDTTSSGTGSIDSVVRANEFVSVTEGMEDYGPLTGCQSFEAGTDLATTPFEVNLDLTGYDRDGGGDTWSIGAVQAESGTPTPTISITSPDAYQIFQRNTGTNQANVTLSGNFSGTMTGVDYRLTPKTTGTPGSWIDLGATITGTWTGVIESLAKGQYLIEVRSADDHSVTASVDYVGVGDVFIAAGQSNANGHVANQLDYSHASFRPGFWKLASTDWAVFSPSAGNSLSGEYSPWGPFATAWMIQHACPVGFILSAVHGTAIASWLPSGSNNNYDNMVSAVTASGVNSVLAALWIQGETDASNGVTRASYRTSERLIGEGLAADVVGSPPLISCHCSPSAGTDDQIEAIRLAKQDNWNESNTVKAGASLYDFVTGNVTADAEVNTLASRLTTVLTDLLFNSGTGRGPRLLAPLINTAKTSIRVVTTKDLAAGSSYGAGAWIVKDNGTPVSISSVTRTSAREITIALASAASGTVTVSLGKGDDAFGLTVPKDSSDLPLETFADEEAVAVSENGTIRRHLGGNFQRAV